MIALLTLGYAIMIQLAMQFFSQINVDAIKFL